jgi:hypothetical protein
MAMTTTMIHSDDTTRTASGADILRGLMRDALSVAADDAADSFHSRTATGRALLSLAAVARQAAGALGAEPGIPVASGPGVVVVREFAAAVRLLDQAASTHAERADVDGFLATAKGLHAQLHDAVARAGR